MSDTIDLPDAEDLLSRAMRSLPRIVGYHASGLRWAVVAEVFGLGPTYSAELCRRHGLDPDEKIGTTDWEALSDVFCGPDGELAEQDWRAVMGCDPPPFEERYRRTDPPEPDDPGQRPIELAGDGAAVILEALCSDEDEVFAIGSGTPTILAELCEDLAGRPLQRLGDLPAHEVRLRFWADGGWREGSILDMIEDRLGMAGVRSVLVGVPAFRQHRRFDLRFWSGPRSPGGSTRREGRSLGDQPVAGWRPVAVRRGKGGEDA